MGCNPLLVFLPRHPHHLAVSAHIGTALRVQDLLYARYLLDLAVATVGVPQHHRVELAGGDRWWSSQTIWESVALS